MRNDTEWRRGGTILFDGVQTLTHQQIDGALRLNRAISGSNQNVITGWG